MTKQKNRQSEYIFCIHRSLLRWLTFLFSCSQLIPGLNIQLDSPELVQKWLAERKKRWPTKAVVEQKALQSWDERPTQSSYRNKQGVPSIATKAEPENKDDSSSDDSSEESDSDGDDDANKVEHKEENLLPSRDDDSDSDSSGSDLDPEKDAISSKVPPPGQNYDLNELKPKPLCRFFQKGTCRNGENCSHRHEIGDLHLTEKQSKKRKRPKAPSPNPFEAPHLLRALLRNEIAQHINYVAQVIRFLVRNDYLDRFEIRSGDAAEQKRRRALIEEIKLDPKETGTIVDQPIAMNQPLNKGALPIAEGALYNPPSPDLKPVDDLSLPPQPDEFALMDPLRAHDAKPMNHEQFRQIALDVGIRASLLENDHHDDAKLSKGMIRALSTLDALPSYNHRASALELILGVSEQSALHSHQIGPTYVRSDRRANTMNGQSTNNGSGANGGGPSRVIGESELFRLGLRVGPLEIQRIRQLASRVSNVIGGPSFELDDEPGQLADEDQFKPWWDEKTRHEMRIKKLHKEGEWRDQMRKLGLEVD